MVSKDHPVYKTEECITDADCGFRFALVENREFSPIEHSHTFYEVVSVFSGIIHHTINGEKYVQRTGDICILRPGDYHLPIRQADACCTAVCSISAELVEPFLVAFNLVNRFSSQKKAVIYRVTSQQLQMLKQILGQLHKYVGQQKNDQCRIITGMLLQFYLQNNHVEQVEWIDQITAKMNTPENLSTGVPALQKIANLSHPQLCRVFRKVLNKTPQQYIKELRLNYAYSMICNTNESYERIAMLVGYSSFSHFTIIFKEQFRQSPSALRKETVKYW